VSAVTEISLILFDLNGVLYHYDRDVRIARLSVVTGRSPDAIRTAVWDSGFEDSGDAGTLDATAYLRGFGARIGHNLSEAEWVAALHESVTPMAEALGVLPRIRPGVRCALLTNNNLLVRRHFAVLYPEVGQLVGDRAHVSAEFGARKPDAQVYRRCLARLGVAPTAALFVDDSAANVDGAVQAGLHGCHYTGSGQLTADLQRRGLLD
jgi:HAD superfamily hydrolase (TIGR01509 family)